MSSYKLIETACGWKVKDWWFDSTRRRFVLGKYPVPDLRITEETVREWAADTGTSKRRVFASNLLALIYQENERRAGVCIRPIDLHYMWTEL